MTPTVEQLMETIHNLPDSDREKLVEWIKEEKYNDSFAKQTKEAKLKADNEKFKKALKWVDENRKEYDGQFVVLEGDELIAHGKNAKELYKIARSKGIESPFIKRVKAEILPFGGW